MGYGTTYTSNMTRNDIIQSALKKVNGLASGEVMSGEQTVDGALYLAAIVREVDVNNKHLWTNSQATLTLASGTWVYTSSNGLPTGILQLEKVLYRTPTADDIPLDILTMQEYAEYTNKYAFGDPQCVYFEFNRALDTRTLYVHPAVQTVNTQSVVTGTDSVVYKCIRSHTGDTGNKPITGANYPLYWEAGGSGPSTWAVGGAYTAPQLLKLWYRRPLYDFTSATDNPDFPIAWNRYLIYRLAFDWSFDHGLPLSERQSLKATYEDAYQQLFPSEQPTETTHHSRARDF